MSVTQRRRVEALERKHGHVAWQHYLDVPMTEWPDWALRGFLGEMTDEQLEEMITELQALTDADMSMAASSQS